MDSSPARRGGPSPPLVVEIVDRLETCGLDRDDYQLYDAVDVEALEQLLTSANENIEVQLTVKGVRLALTPDGVNRVLADSTDSADQ